MSRVADKPDIPPRPFVWQPCYPWQQRALAERLARPDGWPQSLLLTGAAGIGKWGLALNAAQALLCAAPRPDGLACGTCPDCRYVMQLQHPDLMVIEPLDYDDKTGEWKKLEDIPVKHIRAMIDFMHVTGYSGRGKIALIHPAERMNPASANALLKTLEEPSAGNRLILVAHQWQQLPATVRSRCQFWTAPYPTHAESLAFLQAAGCDDPEQLLAHAGGAPLTALMLADAEAVAQRKVWLNTLAQPQRLSPFAAAQGFAGGRRDDNKAQLVALLTVLIGWVSDLTRVRFGARVRFYPEYAENLGKLAPLVANGALFRYYRLLLHYRYRLSHPLQPRLIVEALLNDYRNLFFNKR